MKLVFATHNKNKLLEVRKLLADEIELLGLNDIECTEDIPETSDTIEGNAAQKALYVSKKYNINCFADDTGLEVEVLNGEPGVFSARYADDQKNTEDNMKKLLENLKGKTNRKARFKTVIALCLKGKTTFFEGIVNGVITHEKRGNQGFGYDPIFIPDGFKQTFAELSLSDKNKISHRGKAMNLLIEYLTNGCRL
jgi:XTP/dITP diphosphohydrolase